MVAAAPTPAQENGQANAVGGGGSAIAIATVTTITALAGVSMTTTTVDASLTRLIGLTLHLSGHLRKEQRKEFGNLKNYDSKYYI
jgi:hypothetical protein